MEFAEIKGMFTGIGNVSQDEFIQLTILGYLRGRRYSEKLSDGATKEELNQFADYATRLLLDCGLFANILDGHIAVTFEKGEPAFHCTAVGKRYVEENLLVSPDEEQTDG